MTAGPQPFSDWSDLLDTVYYVLGMISQLLILGDILNDYGVFTVFFERE